MTISAAILLASCGAHPTAAPPTPTTADTPTSHSAPVPAPAPRTLPWFNLQVGDCVDQIPAVDEGAVDVTLVDCATPHRAEVYQRAPIPVDAAVTEVANQRCNDALTAYTGASGSYTVSYLIDSNQDRTADNPLPSIVICLLQDAGGGALTRSAHGR